MTVHAARPFYSTLCGVTQLGTSGKPLPYTVTDDHADVTCERCREVLAKRALRQIERAAT